MSRRAAFLAVVAAALFATGFSAYAGGGPSTEPEQVLPWRALVFQAQRQLVKTRIEVSLDSTSSEAVRSSLVKSPQGRALSPDGPEVFVLKIKSVIDGLLIGRQGYDMAVWFEPVTGAALQRDRLHRGKKPDSKLYRFTDQGVYRLRRKPRDQSETLLAPDRWTRTKESFYPYPERAADCRAVTGSSLLLYKLSVMPVSDNDPLPSLCVFHQQHVHQVTVQNQGEDRVEVDFGQGRRQIPVIRLALQAQALKPEQADESFEFLGLQGEIEVLMAADSRIPVQISGDLPPVGRVAFELSEALTD